MQDEKRSLQYHFLELRRRVLYSLLTFGIATAVMFYYSGRILSFFQTDLGVNLNSFVAYEVLYTQIMLAAFFGFVISLPFILYQIIKFMKPGLRPVEYRLLRNYLPFSMILFTIGAVFAYEVIVKTAMQFFLQTNQAANINSVWGLRATLSFAMKLSAFVGTMFQLPIVAMVLAKAGLINASMMRRYRVYFIVSVLVLAAIATPPDVITQIMITVPVIGLYQLSIFLVARIERF